jgi:DNA-binding PadR family transcriptional regulator
VEERDRRVVELRYGLEDGRARSRAEIGRMLGISRERVRQLESRAVDRLYQHAGIAPHPGDPAADPGTKIAGANGHAAPRHSFLRSWTLVLLWLRPAHVYELRARLRDLGLPPATYRMLQALEREGFLYSHWAPGRGAGPNRRVYSLTPRGVEQLGADAAPLRNMAETLNRFLGEADFLPGDDDSPGGS